MSNFRFELNRAGVRQLLRGDAIQGALKGCASRAKSKLPSGYEQDIYIGKNRSNAMIWAETASARKDNSDNNSILKALR